MDEIEDNVPPTEGAEPSPAPEQAGLQNASPEEQKIYNQIVGNGMMMIYSKKAFQPLLKILEGEGNPREGLSTAATTIVSRLYQASNGRVPIAVMYPAAVELFEELADISTKAGIHDFENDPDGMEGAFFQTVDKFRGMMQSSGALDKEAAERDWNELQAQDQSGQLEQLFTMLAEKGDRSTRSSEEEGESYDPEAEEPAGGLTTAINSGEKER